MNGHTTPALIRLWLNAAFLPVAILADAAAAMRAMQPADDADSGAPEGADVVRLDQYREAR
jgi:hypothetical protein